MRRLAPTSSARERSRVNVSPVLALAGLAAIGLLATRLPRPAWRRVASLDPLLEAGGPLVARTLGLGALIARRIARAAVVETAAGALAITVPLALHRSPTTARAELGWLASLIFAVGGGALIGMAFLSVSRLRPAADDLAFALLATLLFGAGLGYAADLSPLVVSALAAALIVNLSPRRHLVRHVLANGAHPFTAVFLILTGALLTLQTPWILVAAPLVALVRVAAQWGAVRFGRAALRLHGIPPHAGLATVAQGATALALGVDFLMMYGGRATGVVGGPAVLATVVGGVAVAQLAAPALLTLALRAGPAPLTPAPETAELSPR